MRDPPDSAPLKSVGVRVEPLSVRRPETNVVPLRQHVHSRADVGTGDRIQIRSFTQQFVAALWRALATWPI
jgi:hypothetical protein